MGKMAQDAKPRKIWRIVMGLSLAINLLFIGLIGGAFLRGQDSQPRGFDLQLGPLTDALSREDRRKIGQQIRRDVMRSGQSRRDRRVAFEELVSAVEAEPFDPQRLIAVIEEQQDASHDLRQTALTSFVTHLSQMTAQERKDFAQRLREGVQRFRGGGKQPPVPRPSSG